MRLGGLREQLLAQDLNAPRERHQLGMRRATRLNDARRNSECLGLQALRFFAQTHLNDPLIGMASLAQQPTSRLHALEKRRERAGIEQQHLAELADSLLIGLPESE